MLKQRIISSVFIVAAVLSTILAGYPFSSLLFITMVGMMAWEWEKMINNNTSFLAVIYATLGTLCVLFPIFDFGIGIPLILIALSAFIVFIIAKRKKLPFPYLLAFGVVYICLPALSLNIISKVNSSSGILWIFGVVWACDVGGYLFGSLLGGPKLCPRISPKKTWAGFIGGLFLALAFSYAYDHFLDLGYRSLVILTLSLGIIAQIGDLIESSMKRHVGVKDSSNLIPGHGGIFDRIDALLLVVVVYAVLVFVSSRGFINMMIY